MGELDISPKEFELVIKKLFDRMAKGLKNYKSVHRENVSGLDGEYEIDITASFEEFGLTFKILIECKHYKRKVEREEFLALHKKMESLGAQKAVLVTSSGFQKGALEYAKAHGMGAIVEQDGQLWHIEKKVGGHEYPIGPPIRTFVLVTLGETGYESEHNLTYDDKSSMRDIFSLN